ncbi:MAG: methionyl-tRNA formyltransferase [Pseudomonadota bacterium]
MRLVFAGTPPFAAAHLQALIESDHEVISVVTQPDKPGKRGRQPVASAVKQVATDAGLDLLQPGKLRINQLAGLDPDVLVVVAYGQILRPDVLDLPKFGCINVHASLLPRWRGAAPIQRAIQAGDEKTGVCIMQMEAGLDTGPVFRCEEVAITATDTAATLTDRLTTSGCQALLATLDDLSRGRTVARPQPASGVTYASKVTKDEAKLDFSLPAVQLARTIRAFNPDPVAYAFLADLRIRFWEAAATANQAGTSDKPPGTIVAADSTGIFVACGEGVLKVTKLQVPLGKGTVLSVAELLNARRALFSPGQRLTS